MKKMIIISSSLVVVLSSLVVFVRSYDPAQQYARKIYRELRDKQEIAQWQSAGFSEADARRIMRMRSIILETR